MQKIGDIISKHLNCNPNMNNFSLSIIIPVYNEAFRLQRTFVELSNFLSAHSDFHTEIIFVNDGSSDNSTKLINDFISINPCRVKLINNDINRGKGYAVRCGMKNSSGLYCLMVDADMSTPMSEMDNFLTYLPDNSKSIIIGSRKGVDALMIKKQPWYRQKIGEIYAILASVLTGLSIKDYGCGFKLFPREVVDNIFKCAIINRWTFDTEILYIAKKLKYPIIEVGVRWTDDRATKVRLLKDIIQSGLDLIRIVIIHRNK